MKGTGVNYYTIKKSLPEAGRDFFITIMAD